MPAKIIQLKDYLKSTVRCPITGVVFPQVYRRTGKFWDLKEGEDLENSTGFVPGVMSALDYVLSPAVEDDIADPVYEPISRLDPDIDFGWVIVRHHRNEERVRGYIEGRGDLGLNREAGRAVWQTQVGIFSVISRPADPGCPDHLMIFCTAVPHWKAGEEDWMKVIDSSGAEHDEQILSPAGAL